MWSAAVSPVLTGAVHAVVPVPPLAAALLWALDSGLLSMLSVGIPFVLSFYLILAVLEDSGYLTAAAVLADRLFNTFGLPGRAAIPILAATGCNVPAVYGTRVLDSRRERLLATFLVVLTPCSARTAVVIAAIAPFAGPGRGPRGIRRRRAHLDHRGGLEPMPSSPAAKRRLPWSCPRSARRSRARSPSRPGSASARSCGPPPR